MAEKPTTTYRSVNTPSVIYAIRNIWDVTGAFGDTLFSTFYPIYTRSWAELNPIINSETILVCTWAI